MLDVLLVTMSLLSAISIFLLCYISYTLSKELTNNDDTISKLRNEIDKLEENLFMVKEERDGCLSDNEALFEYGGWNTIQDAIKHYKKYVVGRKPFNSKKKVKINRLPF